MLKMFLGNVGHHDFFIINSLIIVIKCFFFSKTLLCTLTSLPTLKGLIVELGADKALAPFTSELN